VSRARKWAARRRAVAVLAVLAMGLGACGAPHVFTEDEFDREAEDFRKAPEDRDFVTVCYSDWESTPAEALEIAEAECGKYGKTARLVTERFYKCPLNTPTEARFACIKS
jgi:hypothetical protein